MTYREYPDYPTDPSGAPQHPRYQRPPQRPPQMPQPPTHGPRVRLLVGILAAVLVVGCLGACVAVGRAASVIQQRAASTAATAVVVGAIKTASANGAATATAGAVRVEDVQSTIRNFCVAEGKHQYTTAYQTLSPHLQETITLAQFISDSTYLDTTQGPVHACYTTNGYPSFFGITATWSLEAGRSPGLPVLSAVTGTIMLDHLGGNWRISYVDPLLRVLCPCF